MKRSGRTIKAKTARNRVRPYARTTERRTSVVPTVMQAAATDRFGGPAVLKVRQMPVPKIGPHDVLIALDTAGVGGWDPDIRESGYGDRKPKFPLVLGLDGAGIVVEAGTRVRRLKVGDKVYSYRWNNRDGGFFAEYVAVEADKVAHIPKGLDLKQAGALAAIGLTALQGIDDAVHLRRNETIIIHGAAGGVGMLAVPFAKLRGARVLATASGRDGMAFARKMGADAVVEGHEGDIAGAAHKFAPDGVDAVLGFAGGDQLELCLDAMKRGGRAAYPNGVEPAPKKRRGMSLIGYDAIAGVREFERLNEAVETAKLRVPIAETFPLADAAHALRSAEGHVLGKIVLRI